MKCFVRSRPFTIPEPLTMVCNDIDVNCKEETFRRQSLVAVVSLKDEFIRGNLGIYCAAIKTRNMTSKIGDRILRAAWRIAQIHVHPLR